MVNKKERPVLRIRERSQTISMESQKGKIGSFWKRLSDYFGSISTLSSFFCLLFFLPLFFFPFSTMIWIFNLFVYCSAEIK